MAKTIITLARAVARLRLAGEESNGDDVTRALEDVAEAAEQLCLEKGVLPARDGEDE